MYTQKISTHLWFDTQAKEAADFYIAIFPDSKITSSNIIPDTPSGDANIVSLELMGEKFTFISAGPYFKINPSVSFLVACSTKEEVDELWNKLSVGGTALMELAAYPFSEKYGWIQDKFGVSWQIMYMGEREITQRITPTIMFVGAVCGKAEEAMTFYTAVFSNSSIGNVMRYEAGESQDAPGTIKHATFTLEGKQFAAMDSAYEHQFSFNEAVSFMVHCDTQEEIDYYWEKLSADPAAEQCGWLKDKFGLSWQITPTAMDKLFSGNDKEKIKRVTEAFLKMKKFDIAKLEEAANQG